MLESIALIIICGVVLNYILQKFNLPALLGYLVAGILLGPFMLDMVDGTLLELSADIRQVALIIILTRAGLSLDIGKLLKVGRPAIMMCFVPATVEIIAALIFGPMLLGLTVLQSLLVGSILAAVSPAVVVPRMIRLIQEERGTDKQLPQMIVAGASADDVYVLVIFSALLTMALGGEVSYWSFLQIPVSIISGIIGGAVFGWLLNKIFTQFEIQQTFQVAILLAVAFILMGLEDQFTGYFSGMLAIIAMNAMIHYKATPLSDTLSERFNHLWTVAEVFLFFLVGVSVNPFVAFTSGVMPIVFIIILSVCRVVIGVSLCLFKTNFNKNEKFFAMISYLPKATVQAAIGSVPLVSGVAGGELMLTLAVLSILITAPLGAIGMDYFAPRLLNKSTN